MQLSETMSTVAVLHPGYESMGWKQNMKYFKHSGCDRCKGTQVSFAKVVAGCRFNGDGYGSYLSSCTDCGLFDWSSYDEA
jgi:hypothetical protein